MRPEAATLLLTSCVPLPQPDQRIVPPVDCHQQLVSPIIPPIVKLPERSGAALVRELDHAAIDRAVVLSETYSFAEERKGLSDRDRLTGEEREH